MDEQLAFFDSKPPPAGPNCLFAGILADSGIRQKLQLAGKQVISEEHLSGKMRPEGHLHLTVYSFGNYEFVPEEDVNAAKAACAFTASRSDVTNCIFDRILTFGGSAFAGQRPLVVTSSQPIPAMQLLSKACAAADAVRRKERQRISTPHATVAYVDGMVQERVIMPVEWELRELVLIHSFQGQTRYEILGRWKLRA